MNINSIQLAHWADGQEELSVSNNVYSRLDLSSFKLKITKCHFFFRFVGFRGFQCCKTLSGKWTVLLFLGVNQFHILNGILNMENVKILPHKTPKNKIKAFSGHFHFAYKCPLNRVLQSFWGVNQVSTTSGSPNTDFVTFCPNRANRPWPKIWHLFFLTLL